MDAYEVYRIQRSIHCTRLRPYRTVRMQVRTLSTGTAARQPKGDQNTDKRVSFYIR